VVEQVTNDQPLLAFVHIPRTGGGTVSTAVSKNYSPLRSPGNAQKNPDATRVALKRLVGSLDRWKAAGDHVPYGLYAQYLPADTRYMTFLREPVDRVLSHYHFHAQAGTTPGSAGARKLRQIWQMLLSQERGGEIVLPDDVDFSLEEGLRRKIPIYDNFMTRFLWGGESLFGELPSDAVERAKENIATFWFVGISERLDDSIVLLGRKLGIGLMPYHRRHVSQKRPPLEETPAELCELIAEHNALDLELYRFARERFEQTAPTPAELAEQAEELRQLSIPVTAAGAAHKAGKKDRVAATRAARREREQHREKVGAERAARKGRQEAEKSEKPKKQRKQERDAAAPS
jgi:hypothetical protein